MYEEIVEEAREANLFLDNFFFFEKYELILSIILLLVCYEYQLGILFS